MSDDYRELIPEQRGVIGRVIWFCLTNRALIFLLLLLTVGAGIYFAPFDWQIPGIARDPIPTDAIPDIGENQQIVFTEWMGRSPQDVEDQVTYPLTTSLLGVAGVKTIRSESAFGFSMIYVIFNEGVDFYWARSRVLERLSALPAGTLPENVQPTMGPDATALGQIFWYTLEGRDRRGLPAGGWDPQELRSIQDWVVRYGLAAAEGVSEVASVGGFVREYQVDADPDAMRAYDVTLGEVFAAVKGANIDVGARTIEQNRVEYFIRSLGFIKAVSDIEDSVIKARDNVPIRIRDVATVTLGPALRRGALDTDGAEAVGGVVVARQGANPLAAIKNVKRKIEDISPGLPSKIIVDRSKVTDAELAAYTRENSLPQFAWDPPAQDVWRKHLTSLAPDQQPPWLKLSKVTIIPFYDRTGLIYETLGTLNDALAQEILVTLIVVIVMMMHLRSSALIGGMLPLTVLLCFISMRFLHVDANIVALSGIAIAIGTIVDMGIVISENIIRHLEEAPADVPRLQVVHRAASEVGSAVLTAVATTVVGFLPVFVMTGAEGKLFRPLAFTKTFALMSSIVIALTIIPPAALTILAGRLTVRTLRRSWHILIITIGIVLAIYGIWHGFGLVTWAGLIVILFGLYGLLGPRIPDYIRSRSSFIANCLIIFLVGVIISVYWEPLGPARGSIRNFLFVALVVGGLLLFFWVVRRYYERCLRWALAHKRIVLSVIGLITVFGFTTWLGFGRVFGFFPAAAGKVGLSESSIRSTTLWVSAVDAMPGFGKEFMPPLDEGSFLYMPTTMVHASMGEVLDILAKQDEAFAAVPEINQAVGKLGRVDSALDPAPISMIETVITYKPEYITDDAGRRISFRYDKRKREFPRDGAGNLIPDKNGRPFRQWRDHIRTTDDIWQEIVKAAQIPGTTSAPKLQPIAARLVMLQSGMRAPMGIKVHGPDLATIEAFGVELEKLLKEVPVVEPAAVIADRIVGKPYLEIVPDRAALARYGVTIRDFQDIVEVAIGGNTTTTTVEGRQRYPVRVRYPRELRDSIDAMSGVLVASMDGTQQVPLGQLADIRYVRGPQMIKSEDTFLTGYVLFDKKPGYAEVDVIQACSRYIRSKIDDGSLVVPPGVSYVFAGTYENQLRAARTLSVILPLALFVIFTILYLQFHSLRTTSLVFSGIFVAWSGGFILIWLYGQPWFLDFGLFGVNMRDLFQVHTINLSVAVWVGFLALFGIASDDGVIMCTYLDQMFRDKKPGSIAEVREATVLGGKRRIRPCLMTTATTILALLPVLTSTGRGSDIMVPMAIPSFGGMLLEVLTMFVVPVLYCSMKERAVKRAGG